MAMLLGAVAAGVGGYFGIPEGLSDVDIEEVTNHSITTVAYFQIVD